VIAVNPTSYAAHKDEWKKITEIYYKCVDYLKDPKTADDAVKIMSAKVGADPADYAKNIPGTHFLTIAEAKTALAGTELAAIKSAMEKLGNESQALGQAIYEAAQAEQAAGDASASAADDNVVDAEVVEDDDEQERK